MRRGLRSGMVSITALAMLGATCRGDDPDPAAIERGRVALTTQSFLKPAWGERAYAEAGKLWGPGAPDPDRDPSAYAEAFNRRYGLNPAPYPNDGLPMGLRRGKGPDGTKVGIQIDCMVCHGGSIGGASHVALGNTQLDLHGLLHDLTKADGQKPPPPFLKLNTARGTVNAGQISAILLALRNPDLSMRTFPLPLSANFPELDTPAWWHLGRKATMYQDGRTDARAVRTNMQFMLGELSRDKFEEYEPAFRDIQAYLKSLKAPKYPFAIDAARADRGRLVFEKNCVRCHGTYGPDGTYPNKIVPLDAIGTDPARALGLSDRLATHYNTTWFGQEYPTSMEQVGYQAPPLDGVWATAPYLHNGSIPNLAALFDSATRPDRFRRPPSTGFDHYDQAAVGWKAEPLPEGTSTKLPPHEAIYDTSRFGLGNGGHTFGDALEAGQRLDLIEYLKTL